MITNALLAWTPFIHPIMIEGRARLLMLLPLAMTIAVVYRTIRCDHVREVPMSAVVLFTEVVVGMFVIGIGLWALFQVMM